MAERGRQQLAVLVGRVREIRELERALDRLASGERWVVQLVGEPGIGKSRLLAELGRRAEQRGYLVLDGRAAEFERDMPFGVILDALNDYLGAVAPALLRSLDDEAVGELASIFPAMSMLAGDPAVTRVAAERYRAHYAIRALLERLAVRQPVVLALDDLHWADAASIEVIAHLMRRFRGPMLGAFAFRQPPAPLAAALDTAARGGLGSRLELVPLTPDDAQALIDPRFDAATRAAVFRESGGNPFYLEQLSRASGAHAQGADLATERSRVSWAPPPGVAAAIRDELASLSDEARLVLDAAAVAGESFEPELIAAIVDRPEPLKALDELLEADLIRPTDAPRRFRFRHPIVRRAVYDGMGRGWRLGAHARAAAALADAHAPASACAHHIERSAIAGDEQAVALLVDAARTAAPRAPLAAGHWLLAALRLLPAGADGERRLELLRDAATALAHGGAFEESLASLQEALVLVPEERASERADLLARIVYAKRPTGHAFESRALLERALEQLAAPDSPAALDLRLELALDDYQRGEFAQMHELALAALVLAREHGDLLLISRAAANCSLADTMRDRVEDAVVELGEAQAAFCTVSDEQLAERVEIAAYMGMAAYALERPGDALEHFSRGVGLAPMAGKGSAVPGWLAYQAFALLMQGRVSEATSIAKTATATALLSGNDRLTVYALGADAMAAAAGGDIDRALDSAREAVACSDRIAQNFFSGLWRLQLAGALYAAGDPTGARTELVALDVEPKRRLFDLRGAHGWELLVRTHLALGDLDAAEDAAARAEARAEVAPLPQGTATVRYARAAVMLARGDALAAARAGREAAESAERTGNPLLGARARALAGGALAAAGEPLDAIAELKHAEAVLSTCGAVREADAAARELRRLGQRVTRRRRPTGSRSGLAALSSREREVADHVATGQTNRDVAAALFLSTKTIETHLARIYDKLGVRSRAALASIIARDGGSGSPGDRTFD
jgi:ATP/maltotriose-dependent transcriptional regulator MalT